MNKGKSTKAKEEQRPSRLTSAGHEESGAIAIIVAIVMVLLLSVVALVVDLGGLYDHDRELQTAADAAVLAGAQELVLQHGDPSVASQAAGKAQQYVQTNAAPNSSVVYDHVAQDIRVDGNSDPRWVFADLVEAQIPFTFARVFSNNEGSVHARALAEVKYLSGINQLFPVALLAMNPNHFNFSIKNGNTTVASFDLYDQLLGQENDQGLYDQGGTTFTPSAAGLYTVTLETHDGDHNVGLTLPGIGLWRAANPGDDKETIYRVGMTQSIGSNSIAVYLETASSVTDASLTGHLGRSFTLTMQSPGYYVGVVTAPEAGNAKDGYATFDLTINKLSKDSLARYIAFNPDVPIEHLIMVPGQYSGYSGLRNVPASISAVVKVRIYTFDQEYTMKLGNQQGAGIYSGNWRLADIYFNQSTYDQVATIDPPPSWELIYPLRLGGPLKSQPGADTGQVIHGLKDRLNDTRYPEDVRRTVILPIVDWDTAIHGRGDYRIQSFAAFYITDFETQGPNKGNCVGQFKHWVAAGEWTEDPPGPLYVETAVLTDDFTKIPLP